MFVEYGGGICFEKFGDSYDLSVKTFYAYILTALHVDILGDLQNTNRDSSRGR